MMSEPSPLHVQTSDIEIENKAINTRRKELGLNEIDDTGTVGLALSGGGIRSATFCLGLVRALAKKGLLKK
jgi:predicted acylesterase/phospholipase RssA